MEARKEIQMGADQVRDDLVEDILELSDRAFRGLFPIVPKEWLRLDLTMSQLKVVLLLFTGGPARMSVIATELGVSLATATGVVDRLVERGLLVREGDPEDRRVVLCELSEKGERLIGGLWQVSREQVGDLMKALAPPQRRLIRDALEALVRAGDASGEVLR
jgi:DNA-binding MarR family transcriptional regulator